MGKTNIDPSKYENSESYKAKLKTSKQYEEQCAISGNDTRNVLD